LAESTNPRAGLASAEQVIGLLIGPLAWAADQIISYALVQHTCSTGHHYVLHVMTAVFFAVAIAGAVMSWRQYLEFRAGNDEGGSAFDRSHFLALMGVLSSVGFAVVITANAVPRWVLSPCD
jgi:hypothetical protein